jgi:hypothetical protein
VFTIIELLALWFLVNGAKCGLRKAEWLTLSAGILFFWITLSATKASFQYEILSPLKKLTWMPLDRQTLVVNAVIAAVILAAVLLFALNRSRAELSRRTLIVCLALTAFLWPLMSGGPLVAASTAMNTLNGMGTWTVAAKFTKSKAAEKIAAYDDISAWIRQNTPATVRIFTLDNDRAQNLKLSGLRSGCGKFDEIGFADLSVDIDKFYADAQSQEPEAAARTARLLDRLGISLILASKEIDFGPLKKSAGLSPLYENKYFIILTRKQHEAK